MHRVEELSYHGYTGMIAPGLAVDPHLYTIYPSPGRHQGEQLSHHIDQLVRSVVLVDALLPQVVEACKDGISLTSVNHSLSHAGVTFSISPVPRITNVG